MNRGCRFLRGSRMRLTLRLILRLLLCAKTGTRDRMRICLLRKKGRFSGCRSLWRSTRGECGIFLPGRCRVLAALLTRLVVLSARRAAKPTENKGLGGEI